MKRLLSALALVTCTACADQAVTQYVGTVMSEASPEAEGTLRLTLFERTDTSFSGIMELGEPVKGTGSAYAWFEGPELRIVTVGAMSADTILWTSKLTDEGLGGRYEVTGGKREGEAGTWRARLTKGPPATPATLRLPPRAALPPASATWPLLLLAGVAAWLARWIRGAPRPGTGDASEIESSRVRLRPDLAGIAGWLVFFTLAQAIVTVVGLLRLRPIWSEYSPSFALAEAVPGMHPLLVLELAVRMVTPAIALAGIVLILRRSPLAPRYWLAWFCVSAVFTVIDLLGVAYLASAITGLLGPEYADTLRKESGTRAMGRQLGMSIVWAVYWARSDRVRATFGATATDRRSYATAASAPAVIASSEPSVKGPSRWRRRGRLALRAAGALGAVLLILGGITAWQTRVRPYSVAPGTDIRKAVAGKWGWTTDGKGCDAPHTIAFSDDGKLMTIAQTPRELGSSDDTTTTYDIQQVTQSTIRGAIRGETRLKADGTPVVWDLVLVGPNEYRWRRTDWSSPWGYTARIVRCPADAVTEGPSR